MMQLSCNQIPTKGRRLDPGAAPHGHATAAADGKRWRSLRPVDGSTIREQLAVLPSRSFAVRRRVVCRSLRSLRPSELRDHCDRLGRLLVLVFRQISFGTLLGAVAVSRDRRTSTPPSQQWTARRITPPRLPSASSLHRCESYTATRLRPDVTRITRTVAATTGRLSPRPTNVNFYQYLVPPRNRASSLYRRHQSSSCMIAPPCWGVMPPPPPIFVRAVTFAVATELLNYTPEEAANLTAAGILS